MKKLIKISLVLFIGLIMGLETNAQYSSYDGPNRYFYEEEFDWRWDLRVRISEGYNLGYLSRRQANRLYKRLEKIERKEWAYQADGYYSVWEQDDVWRDIVDLNRRLGLMLTDWDRPYYGYHGVVITRPLRWYYGPTYDFYRFDRLGYGSITIGYAPRRYVPVKHVYYSINKTYISNYTAPQTVTSRRVTSTTSRVTQPRRVQAGGNTTSGSRTVRSNATINSGRSASESTRVTSTRNNTANSRVSSSAATTSSRSSTSRNTSTTQRVTAPGTSSTSRSSSGSTTTTSRATAPASSSARSSTSSSRSSSTSSSTSTSRASTPAARSTTSSSKSSTSSRASTPTRTTQTKVAPITSRSGNSGTVKRSATNTTRQTGTTNSRVRN